MTQEQKPEPQGEAYYLQTARTILREYVEAFAFVDEGELFFAATQFKSAYDQQAARIKELEAEVARLHEKYDFQILVKRNEDLERKLRKARESLRKSILWGESMYARLLHNNKENINWTVINEARETLKEMRDSP